MKRFINPWMLVAVFFAGCAAAQIVVPPARAGANNPQWEYTCANFGWSGLPKITERLNEFGAEGWEVSFVEGSVACFKRSP